MSNEQDNERLRRISFEAACWYVLCSDDPASLLMERRLEFAEWIRESPDHIREILQISRMYKRMRRVKFLVRAVQVSNVISFPSLRRNRPSPNPSRVGISSRRGVLRVAAVGFMALLLVCASTTTPFTEILRVETQARELKHVPLPDGSVIHLSGLTKVAITFSENERLVNLFEGEAVFEVAKDSARPFVVRTHLIDATAVGTRYGVAIGDGVTTTVSEGVVRVGQRGGSEKDVSTTVTAGQQLHVRTDLSRDALLRNVDGARALSWAAGWLVFDGATVRDAVTALNRFNDVQIVVGSGEIAKRRIQYYRARINEPEEFAEVVAAWPDVRLVTDRETKSLHLVKR